MNKIHVTLFGLFLALTGFSQYDPEALTVLDATSEKYKSYDAYKASFSQKLVNETAKLDETRDGSIIVKGNKYALTISQFIVLNNSEVITTYNEEINEVTISYYDPSEETISINNIYDIYKNGYKYTLLSTNQNGDRIIELDPEDRNVAVFKVRMIINASDEIKSFIVYERDGNQYTYTINNFEPTTIADDYFDFNEANYDENVDVVDFR